MKSKVKLLMDFGSTHNDESLLRKDGYPSLWRNRSFRIMVSTPRLSSPADNWTNAKAPLFPLFSFFSLFAISYYSLKYLGSEEKFLEYHTISLRILSVHAMALKHDTLPF